MRDQAEPLRIDTVAVPGGGLFGMLHCPGRCGAGYGARDLSADFAAVEQWGAALLVTLNEPHEFARMGVPEFITSAKERRFRWLHAPIPDMHTPGPAFTTAWAIAGPAIASALDGGDKIAVHCAAGLGRTGTLVAKLLVDRGVAVDEAIARVRRARPGTIETAGQAAFVRNAPRLLA
jgi:rhodanese-related sulfurtransferase